MTTGSMLDEHRDWLRRFRRDSSAWSASGYQEAHNAEGLAYDGHFRHRFGVLVCLQYDFHMKDYQLVRYLFEQEITGRKRGAFQGLTPALKIGAYLLAHYRDVSHVWLFWQAKKANFDCWLGLDWEYLFSAGPEETLKYVHAQ